MSQGVIYMFPERLKQLRKLHNLTQAQFAKEFNISQGTVGMWETNRREPDFETTARIADYFNVTVDYLLGRDEKKPTPGEGGGLDEKQMELVKLFRAATPELQAAALAVLRSAEGQGKAPGGVSEGE